MAVSPFHRLNHAKMPVFLQPKCSATRPNIIIRCRPRRRNLDPCQNAKRLGFVKLFGRQLQTHRKPDRSTTTVHNAVSCYYSVATVENGCFAGTNSTGTPFTNPFNQRVHSSIPACSLGMCPITINAFLLPSVTASSTYSTVSHSTVSPTSNTSTSSLSNVCVSRSNPSDPGLNAIFVTFISGLPTYRTTGDPNFFATCSAKFFTVVSGITNKCSLSEL